jgi:hypothetical protein
LRETLVEMRASAVIRSMSPRISGTSSAASCGQLRARLVDGAELHDHAPVDRGALDGGLVRDDVLDGGHLERTRGEVVHADGLELAGALDLAFERDDIDGFAGRLQIPDRLEEDAVARVEEIVGFEVLDQREHLVAQQDAADDRALGAGVRRERLALGVATRRDVDDLGHHAAPNAPMCCAERARIQPSAVLVGEASARRVDERAARDRQLSDDRGNAVASSSVTIGLGGTMIARAALHDLAACLGELGLGVPHAEWLRRQHRARRDRRSQDDRGALRCISVLEGLHRFVLVLAVVVGGRGLLRPGRSALVLSGCLRR